MSNTSSSSPIPSDILPPAQGGKTKEQEDFENAMGLGFALALVFIIVLAAVSARLRTISPPDPPPQTHHPRVAVARALRNLAKSIESEANKRIGQA